MHQVISHIKLFAASLGLPGLALVSFLDSSSIPFPEVADGWMMSLVVKDPSRWVFYASLVTISSVAGCYVLYLLARKGGESFIRRRLHERHVERGLAAFKRYGLLTVVVPAILPPPVPYKPFILVAGVARVPHSRFLVAVTLGRAFRYGGEALLAYLYGARAIAFVGRNFAWISVAAAGIVLVIGVVVWLASRRARSARA